MPSRNNHSPRLIVEAVVSGKLADVSHTMHQGNHVSGTMTYYYATFQVSSGDGVEFSMSGQDLACLPEAIGES